MKISSICVAIIPKSIDSNACIDSFDVFSLKIVFVILLASFSAELVVFLGDLLLFDVLKDSPFSRNSKLDAKPYSSSLSEYSYSKLYLKSLFEDTDFFC